MSQEESAGPDILTTDLNAPAMLSNIFRVRADRLHTVIDFGYALPMMAPETSVFEDQQVDVHSRVVLPYELVLQRIERLQQSVDAARDAGALAP